VPKAQHHSRSEHHCRRQHHLPAGQTSLGLCHLGVTETNKNGKSTVNTVPLPYFYNVLKVEKLRFSSSLFYADAIEEKLLNDVF